MNNSSYIDNLKKAFSLEEPFETVFEYKMPSGSEFLVFKDGIYYVLAASLRGYIALTRKIPSSFAGNIVVPSIFYDIEQNGRKCELDKSIGECSVLSAKPVPSKQYPTYVISSKKDDVFAEVKRAETLSKRKADNEILLEEERLVKRAVDDGNDVKYIFYTQRSALLENGTIEKAKKQGLLCFSINEGLMASLTETKPVPKETALVRLPRLSLEQLAASGIATVLIADNIENPDNLGLIIRTADACGADAVISCGTEASVFHKNSVRASRGAMGRFPVFEYDVADFGKMISELKALGFTIFGSSAKTKLTVHDTGDIKLRAFVVSNETDGITDRMRNVCDEMIRIPMATGQSSFNVAVAAGIILAFGLKFE